MSKQKRTYIRYFLHNIPRALRIRFLHKPGRTSRFGGQKGICLEQTEQALINLISSGKPFAALRVGGMEMSALNGYEKIRFGFAKTYKEAVRYTMKVNAGYYPCDDDSLNAYAKRLLPLLKETDLLGISGYHMEDYFLNVYCPNARAAIYLGFEPLLTHWTPCLKGKKVLVISPFTEEIAKQYERRELLFPKGSDILPEMELRLLKAPLTQGDVEPERTSLEELDRMEKEMEAIDFDIALIGAGVYGNFLALHAKKLGKQAIQTGGATMTLFGIIGKRWQTRNHVSQYLNEYWIRPFAKIPGYEKIDKGAYW